MTIHNQGHNHTKECHQYLHFRLWVEHDKLDNEVDSILYPLYADGWYSYATVFFKSRYIRMSKGGLRYHYWKKQRFLQQIDVFMLLLIDVILDYKTRFGIFTYS